MSGQDRAKIDDKAGGKVGRRGRKVAKRTLIASIGYITVCSYCDSQREGRVVEIEVGGCALTAIPAKAPAAMFCSREKLGGRDS